MNVLHGFFDDFSCLEQSRSMTNYVNDVSIIYLTDALMWSDDSDRIAMNKKVTIGQQFNSLDEQHVTRRRRCVNDDELSSRFNSWTDFQCRTIGADQSLSSFNETFAIANQ
jgi:hypothetical protein